MTAVLAAASVLILCIFWPRTFVRYHFSLPYIWDPNIRHTLLEYIRTQPSRHVYLLAGGRKTGKSAALGNLAGELRDAGYQVLDFDFSHVKKRDDVTAFARLAAMEVEEKGMLQLEIGASVPFFSVENDRCIMQFFDMLESMEGSLPIVMVRGVHKLSEFAPGWVNVGLKMFAERGGYEYKVPVLVETRDTMFRAENMPDCIRVLDFDEMVDAKKNLVKQLKAFSSEEFMQTKAVVGVNGGMIDKVFESLRQGVTIGGAIDKELARVNATVQKRVRPEMNGVVGRLCQAWPRPINVNSTEIDDVATLIRSGLLVMSDSLSIQAVNRAVWRALCA